MVTGCFFFASPPLQHPHPQKILLSLSGYNNLTALVLIFNSPLSFTVLPGAPASTSILAASATVGGGNLPVPTPILLVSTINLVAAPTCSTAACRFVIVSKDAANNLRWNAFGQAVITDDDYTVNVITSLDPPITAIVNKLRMQRQQIVATTKTGASIVNSVFGAAPTGVLVNPAPPFGPNSEAVGTGVSGCEQNKEVTFTFTPYDIYFNNEILYTDYPLETGSVEVLEVKVGAVQVLPNVTKECSHVTKNANCSNYEKTTNCSNFGCAGKTFGVCGRYREYWVQSFATPGTSYARLVRYEARPNNKLLRAGQTTNGPVVDWWYVQNLDNAGQPKFPYSCDFFTVELTSVTNPNLKIAITSSSMFRAKVFYKGAFQTKASPNGTNWVSDQFTILIGEVDSPKSKVDSLPATINAGDTGSFLVQLVNVYAQVHNAPYCVLSWNNITKLSSTALLPQTTSICAIIPALWRVSRKSRFSRTSAKATGAKAEGYLLNVIAGPPDLTTSYPDPLAHGSTENPYTAGEVNYATLYLKDEFGNPATIHSNFASTVGSNFGSGTGAVVMTKISSGSTATVAISVTRIDLNTRLPYDPVSKKWKSKTNMFNLTFGGVTVSGGGSANFMLYSQPGVPCTHTLSNCQPGRVTALECPVPRSVAGEFMYLTCVSTTFMATSGKATRH
eukprot:g48694.t1